MGTEQDRNRQAGRMTPTLSFPTLLRAAAVALAALAFAPARAADGLFTPVLYIDGQAITAFELEQRIAFLTLLRTPGDLEELAREGLIEDRLRNRAAEGLEIEITPEALTQGQTEFAARANLELDAFLVELEKGGVAPETFRDFVRSGLVWREVVRARFGPFVSVSEAEITRAFDQQLQEAEVRLLLSEIVIPFAPERQADAEAFVDELRAAIRTEADFAAAAREYSRSPTAEVGGELDWLPIGNLPSALGPQLLQLGAGRVSEPLALPNAIALFFVRAISDGAVSTSRAQEVDYAQFLLPDGPGLEAEVARLRAGSDQCDDLYTLARGLPADRLTRTTQPLAQVPGDIALELARLDPGESSTALRRGGWRVFLMLCARTPVAGEDSPSREQVRTLLINRKLALRAENLLRELRANAIIREP
jgi:peptidyl-prolyl cis-trans isomerase SurA